MQHVCARPRPPVPVQVFTLPELQLIAELCQKHDVIAMCDEVRCHKSVHHACACLNLNDLQADHLPNALLLVILRLLASHMAAGV
jgi:bifunctional pyridoxal-dependent enzyme with beta-cystathionase and maltose regulon repressor activities